MADNIVTNEHTLNSHAPDSYSSQPRYAAGGGGGTTTSEVYSWPRRLHSVQEPRNVPNSLPAGAPSALPSTRVMHVAPPSVLPLHERAHSRAHWLRFGGAASDAPEIADAGETPDSEHMASRNVAPDEQDFQFDVPRTPSGTGPSYGASM